MAQGWSSYPPVEATNGAATSSEMASGGAFSADLPPAGKVPGKRLRLENGGQIRREICKVYRDMKAGVIDINKGSKLVYVLNELSRAVEREAVERLTERLDKAEGK